MSDFWKALDEARALARGAGADACVVYTSNAYRATLLSKARPIDVVVEVADDSGMAVNRFQRRV